MTQAPPPAGWYPQGDQERWWDGNGWSESFRPLASAPPAGAPAYGQPAYGQPAYGQPAYGQPVQQSHTARNLLIVFGVLFLLVVGGCVAVVAVLGNKVNDELNDDTPGGPNNPLTITEGKAFEVAGFEYAAGWSIEADAGGFVSVKNLKLTNDRDESSRLLVEIQLLSGNEVLASAECGDFQSIAEDTTVTVTCTSSDTLPAAYDKITIQDSF
jgi:uncharacterized protein DUF2510